jgi:pimeloyl-ACP methyl ester carboxylesterase
LKKKYTQWLKYAVLVYIVLGIALYFLQDYILFQPLQVSSNAAYHFKNTHKEVNIPIDKESKLNIVQFTTLQKPKGVVLYFHGNKKNISWYAKYSNYFTKNNYEVWMIDYPGYGKSNGNFSEENLYKWSVQFYKLARASFSIDSIIIYGKSMGTGLAAQLASIRDCKQLILETPYYSFPQVLKDYIPIYPVNFMLKYKIPTYEYLQKVDAPITIFHGTNDWIIRNKNANKLKPFLKNRDQFISIKGGSHNNLFSYPQVVNTLDSLLQL